MNLISWLIALIDLGCKIFGGEKVELIQIAFGANQILFVNL